MKTALTAIILFLAFASMAQRHMRVWQNDSLSGKVKNIRTSKCTLASKAELGIRDTNWVALDSFVRAVAGIILYEDTNDLRAMPLDTNDYSVQTFDEAGYWTSFYDVRDQGVQPALHFSYKFDTNGHLIESRQISEDDDRIYHITFRYDQAGNLLQQSHYTNGSFVRGTRYTYESGLLIAAKDSLWSQDVINQETTYKYNDKGQIIEKTEDSDPKKIFNDKCRKSTTQYAYNDKGDKISETWHTCNTTYTSKFDGHGNLLGYGDRVWFHYFYDNRGNWIRRIEDKPTEPTRLDVKPGTMHLVTIRDIEYY